MFTKRFLQFFSSPPATSRCGGGRRPCGAGRRRFMRQTRDEAVGDGNLVSCMQSHVTQGAREAMLMKHVSAFNLNEEIVPRDRLPALLARATGAFVVFSAQKGSVTRKHFVGLHVTTLLAANAVLMPEPVVAVDDLTVE